MQSRYGDELEDKRLYAVCHFYPELLHLKPLHDGLVEVAYECREQEQRRAFCLRDMGSPPLLNPLSM